MSSLGLVLDGFYRAVRPALSLADPERAHRLAVLALQAGLYGHAEAPDPVLACRVAGLDVTSPVGLAAGFDKDAEVPDAALALGFGHVEVGGVTPRPQPGNPRPRLFRLDEDGAVINRYGLNSAGLDIVAARLAARRQVGSRPVGVNLGKHKDTSDEAADFVEGARRLAPLADFLVVNVSSPNTPGLRNLQGRDSMRRIVLAVKEARDAAPGRHPPLLVKLAPDLDDAGLADAAAVALETGLDGLIMGNTTVARPPELASRHRGESGGLSGKPLLGPATERLGALYRATGGRLPLIGTGGISSGQDAYAKIRAGASLVQLYTAMVFEGPGLAARVNRDLAALLHRDGFRSVAEAVGADHR